MAIKIDEDSPKDSESKKLIQFQVWILGGYDMNSFWAAILIITLLLALIFWPLALIFIILLAAISIPAFIVGIVRASNGKKN